jgi:plastocyanin
VRRIPFLATACLICAASIPLHGEEPAVVEITVPAGTETVFDVTNNGAAIHNMHVASASGVFTGNPCDIGGEDPCSNPNIIKGKETATLTVNLEAGKYPFRCDFHPDAMKGTLVVE